MTARPPSNDWSDARIEAAFAARASAAGPTPPDVAAELLARIPARRARDPRSTWFGAAAAAVAVAVLVGAGGLLNQPLQQPGPSAPSSVASGEPAASADATPAPDPLLVAMGDPITVSEALAVRDSDSGGQEVLVRGYLGPAVGQPCFAWFPPRNPAIPPCGDDWMMEQPEVLSRTTAVEPARPIGPAFQPSFALMEPRHGPRPSDEGEPPTPAVLLGHFHDRRAARCDDFWRAGCDLTFVVDRVVEVDGAPRPVTTERRTAATTKDIPEVLDALVGGVAPGAVVVGRLAVEVQELFDLEPVLRDDGVLSNWDPAGVMWMVTAVDTTTEAPIARTFVLVDGSNWFAEITADEVKYLERTAPVSSPDPQVPLASGDPSAFYSAPTEVLGIPVRDIATLQRARSGAMDQLGRDEHAIRAWYLGPKPGVTCAEPVPAIHEPRPPCDDARHWLLDDPQQYGVEEGQLRANPAADHYPPVINPLVPIDVSFDVGPTWDGETPKPRPVIVLGHFSDNRVDTYAGNLYFVIDALAWTPDRPIGSLDTVVRLTDSAIEDPASVLARTAAVNPKPAVATWVTVVDAEEFRALDRRADNMPEFRTGAPVWMVARLVPSEMDGRGRLAAEWTWTADGGNRVWWIECADCGPDLATTLDIVDLDANTEIVRVFDYEQVVTAVGSATGLSGLTWIQPHGNSTDWMDVAQGRTSREVVFRWTGAAACGSWRITVREFDEGRIYLSASVREDCDGDPVVRRILLEFENPVDVRRIEGPSCCG